MHCSLRYRASSQGSLESPGRRVSSGVSTLQRIRQRGRERKTWGPKSLVEQGCFNDLSVGIYRLLYKDFLSTMIKIRKPNVQQLLSRKEGISNGRKVRRQSVSGKRVVTKQFCHKENVYWRKSTHAFHPMTSGLGAACHSTRSRYQELRRNRGFMRDRKQHTGILLLNIPWHHLNTVYIQFQFS